MEADIPLGWKPLNIEQYEGTTNSDEHLDAILTQGNLYTNNDLQHPCRMIECAIRNQQSHRMTSAALASL
ncbi:hypothetical protein JHK84_050359 [Glycine max]|nr:hypothetical protein JHK86_050297 [Glycine max]KAG5094771.1 hypothetical protein JHK84_050359 [Glycine max]